MLKAGSATTPGPDVKLAILTDLHANREAVEAVLDHAAAQGARRYAFLGDYVGYGADPAWVVDTVARYGGDEFIVLLLGPVHSS